MIYNLQYEKLIDAISLFSSVFPS